MSSVTPRQVLINSHKIAINYLNMAKGKKTGGRDFLPGVVTNPHGRPKTDQEIKAIQTFTRSEINRVFHTLINSDTSQCFEVKHNPNSTILEQGIAKVLEAFALYGDMNKFSALAAHCGLAVPKNLELPKSDDIPESKMTAEELTKIVLFIRQLKKEKEEGKLVSGKQQEQQLG